MTEFLRDFPTVSREQALGVLGLMKERLLTDYETLTIRTATATLGERFVSNEIYSALSGLV